MCDFNGDVNTFSWILIIIILKLYFIYIYQGWGQVYYKI